MHTRSDEQVLFVYLFLFAGIGVLLFRRVNEEASAPLAAHMRLEQLLHRLGLLILFGFLLAPLFVQLRLRGCLLARL